MHEQKNYLIFNCLFDTDHSFVYSVDKPNEKGKLTLSSNLMYILHPHQLKISTIHIYESTSIINLAMIGAF